MCRGEGAYGGKFIDRRLLVGGGAYWLSGAADVGMAYGGGLVEWFGNPGGLLDFRVRGFVGLGTATLSERSAFSDGCGDFSVFNFDMPGPGDIKGGLPIGAMQPCGPGAMLDAVAGGGSRSDGRFRSVAEWDIGWPGDAFGEPFGLRQNLFLAEPQASIHLNVTSWVRITGGAGYRLIGGCDNVHHPGTRLTGRTMRTSGRRVPEDQSCGTREQADTDVPAGRSRRGGVSSGAAGQSTLRNRTARRAMTMPSTNEIARSLKLRRPGPAQAPAPAVHHEGPSTDDEPLADRVHRQLTTGRIDEDRLMPSVEKRTRDVHKKLDRMAAGGGWGIFASNAAWSVQNAKAPVRRNAELSLLNEAARCMPFNMGGHFAADLGYGMAGPGGRGTGTPYAGVTRSGMGYRTMRYGWRWAVGERFSLDLEGARQRGFGRFAQPVLGDTADQIGGTQHSVQVRGGVSF